MQYQDLVYVEPIENYIDKEQCLCRVRFISGRHKQELVKMNLTTRIFRYYFWGVTVEVLTYDEHFNYIAIRDMTKEDMIKYGIGMGYTLTYNTVSTDMLASNGFVYNLKDSLLHRNYPMVCETIHRQICCACNFAMGIFTLNGALFNVHMSVNLTPKEPYYKHALTTGFVPMDKKKLAGLVPKTEEDINKREKLNQEDIDKLIRDMQMRGDV